MMEKKHHGKKYEYQIVADFKNCIFEIHSKHIETNSVSTITNLNFILSEFASYYYQYEEMEETTWKIKKNDTMEILWKMTNRCFENTDFILTLEKELDIDRICGGWNSKLNF